MMKKVALFIAVAVALMAMLAVSAFAYDQITLPGTTTPPTIDCKLDDCYVKIHDFYTPDVTQWYDASDADHAVKGTTYATWDAGNLYIYITVAENNYTPINNDTVSASGSCMYLALLADTPVADAPSDPLYVCQLAVNRADDGTLAWKYTGSVDEAFRDNSVDMAIYKTAPFTFDVENDGTNTVYEIALPWNQIDHKGDVKFEAGHQFTFNYIVCADNGGGQLIAQYGQGLMNDIYDLGGIVTLAAAPVPETTAPETTAAPAADTAAAAAAPAAAATATTAAQTSDAVIPMVITLVLAAAAVCVYGRRKFDI
jgi:hypothetical protein